MIDKYTKFFKALGEPTRLKILKLIAEREMCVCELIEVLDMNQPRISQHLKVLKEAGVVYERKQAQWSYYSLCCEDFQNFIEAFINFIKEDIQNISELAAEYQRLASVNSNVREELS